MSASLKERTIGPGGAFYLLNTFASKIRCEIPLFFAGRIASLVEDPVAICGEAKMEILNPEKIG